MSLRQTICIDFDGVMYDRPRSEVGNMDYSGIPVLGAMNFIRHATSAFNVIVSSARFNGYQGQESLEDAIRWFARSLREENLMQKRRGKPGFDVDQILEKINFTGQKPIAYVYLDDRAVCFRGEWPQIKDLIAFKTWRD